MKIPENMYDNIENLRKVFNLIQELEQDGLGVVGIESGYLLYLIERKLINELKHIVKYLGLDIEPEDLEEW